MGRSSFSLPSNFNVWHSVVSSSSIMLFIFYFIFIQMNHNHSLFFKLFKILTIDCSDLLFFVCVCVSAIHLVVSFPFARHLFTFNAHYMKCVCYFLSIPIFVRLNKTMNKKKYKAESENKMEKNAHTEQQSASVMNK